jgi:hypothetical protein
VLPGLTWSVDHLAQCAPVTSSPARTLDKRVLQTTVHIRELTGNAYRSLTFSAFIDNNTSPPPLDQNIAGAIYNTETGFFNSAFPMLPGRGDLARAGWRSGLGVSFRRVDWNSGLTCAGYGSCLVAKGASVPAGDGSPNG